MARSYLFVNKNDYNIFYNNNILKADAIVIDVFQAVEIFKEFTKYEKLFDKFINLNIELYLRLDTTNLKNSYNALKKINPKYFIGWVIPNASLRLMNKLSLKVRDYEQSNQLPYGLLNFIALIDSPNGVVNAKKIAKYSRVKALYLDYDTYCDNLGLQRIDYTYRTSYLREKIILASQIAFKEVIDGFSTSKEVEQQDIILGKNLGFDSRSTDNLSEIEIVNEIYTPTSKEITEAFLILDTYIKSSKKERKNLVVNDRRISPNLLLKSKKIIEEAKRLNLEMICPDINLQVKGRKVKEVIKREPTFKKFYTVGEEIGNSVSHGAGVVFAIVMLILLIIKGSKIDALHLSAYIVFGITAIILYTMSTLYHSLFLGTRAKQIFQRFDHMTIYLLISGTYTPFTLLVIGGELGKVLFYVLWIGATIGLLLNLFWFGRFRALHMILYVVLGWVAIFFMPQIIANLPLNGLILLIAGGVMYTLGIIFYGLKLFKFTHMVWHFFVLAGTILHFFSIFLYT